MKKLTLVTAVALLVTATTVQSITWQKVYGGDNGGAQGNCVQETADGGYIVTGTWSLMKLNEYGDTLWTRDYGGGTWIEQTTDEGFIVSGEPDLLKASEEGDSSWAYNYELGAICVRQTSDGSYMLTGTQGSGGRYLVLSKTNTMGDSLWLWTYEESGNNINVGRFVEEVNGGGFIVTGKTGFIDEEYNEWALLWIIRTNEDGVVLWSKTYGEQEWNSPNEGYCVRQTQDNGYIIAGKKSSGGFWLLKTNETGDTLWTRTYGGDKGTCVLETPDGYYVAVGHGPADNLFESSLPNGGDVVLIKVDPDGNTLWSRNHGGDRIDGGDCVAPASDGGYIVTGYSHSFTSSSALYILKTDSLGLWEAIVEEPKHEGIIAWEGTNIGNQITLSYSDFPSGFQARIFDISGREVDVVKMNSSAGSLTWGKSFPSGVYFIQAIDNKNQLKTAKVVLVR